MKQENLKTVKTIDEIKHFIQWCRKAAERGGTFLKKHYAEMLSLLGKTNEALKVLSGKLDIYIIPVTMKQLCELAEQKFICCRLNLN